MNSNICYIAGAGHFADGFPPRIGQLIIAADAGFEHLNNRGINPDIIVGDFDSLSCIPNHPNIIKCPSAKDDTDMLLAVKLGLSYGCDTFYLNGGLGGRLDHTLANIQTLIHISKNGARGYLIGDDMCVTAVTDGTLTFTANARGIVSVFCFGDMACGVCLTGLKYPLSDAVLSTAYPQGVSNEFTGSPSSISVRTGSLVVMFNGMPHC